MITITIGKNKVVKSITAPTKPERFFPDQSGAQRAEPWVTGLMREPEYSRFQNTSKLPPARQLSLRP